MNHLELLDPLFDSDVLRMAERRALACVCGGISLHVREIHSRRDVILDEEDCGNRGNGKFVRSLHCQRWMQKKPMRLCVRDPHGGKNFVATWDVSAEWPYIDTLRPINLQTLHNETLAHFLPWVLYQLGATRSMALREHVHFSWEDIEHARCRLTEHDGSMKLIVRNLPTVFWVLLEGICALEADERIANRFNDTVSLAHVYLNEEEATRLGAALHTRERPLRHLDLSSCRVYTRAQGICWHVCLAKATFTELLSLQLQRNPLTSPEIENLSRAIQDGRFPVLSRLNMRSTSLITPDMEHFAPALTCLSSSLDRLDLSNNFFGNQGLDYFIKETRLERLTELDLGGTTGLDSKGLICLARHLRNAEALPKIWYVQVPSNVNPCVKDLVRHAVNEVRSSRCFEVANKWALQHYPDV